MKLDGEVALVTGGGAGIGLAITTLLAERGAAVVFNDLNADRVASTTAAHLAAKRVVSGLPGDASSVADIDALFSYAEATHGPVSIVVCNAFSATSDGLATLALEDWERDLHGTLTSAFITVRRALPVMIEQGKGSIVTIGSINSTGSYGADAYSAGKAGLENLTRSLAVRYGRHGIRANMVMPGSVGTDVQRRREALDSGFLRRLERWYPLGRIGTPDDIARAVAFLASDESSWTTGATLTVDGGLLAGNGVMTSELMVESGDLPR